MKADEKRVIPYGSHGDLPMVDPDQSWNGPAAVQGMRRWASSDGSGDKDKIDFPKYAQGFAWVNEEDPENFGSYKLPHHIARDGLRHHFRGTVAAMQVLLGARGGVDIPSGQRRGVYNHLAREYRRYDREPPDFREAGDYTEKELRAHSDKTLVDWALAWIKQQATSTQTIIASKERFSTAAEARKWVADHGFKTDKMDETSTSYRFRQFAPGQCQEDTFRTIELTDGVSAVICRRKERQVEEPVRNEKDLLYDGQPFAKGFDLSGRIKSVKQVEPGDLERINNFALKRLEQSEVAVYSANLANNQVDRDNERFSDELLEDFAATIVGKSLLVAHQWGPPGIGRFFKAEVTTDDAGISWLKASFYLLRDGNEALLKNIDAGIVWAMSIGFFAPDRVSVFGQSGDRLFAEYRRGPNGEKGEAIEGSLVFLGAQFDAAVTKQMTNRVTEQARTAWAHREEGRKVEKKETKDEPKDEPKDTKSGFLAALGNLIESWFGEGGQKRGDVVPPNPRTGECPPGFVMGEDKLCHRRTRTVEEHEEQWDEEKQGYSPTVRPDSGPKCPPGERFNKQTGQCEPMRRRAEDHESGAGDKGRHPVPPQNGRCPPGMRLDRETNMCVEKKKGAGAEPELSEEEERVMEELKALVEQLKTAFNELKARVEEIGAEIKANKELTEGIGEDVKSLDEAGNKTMDRLEKVEALFSAPHGDGGNGDGDPAGDGEDGKAKPTRKTKSTKDIFGGMLVPPEYRHRLR